MTRTQNLPIKDSMALQSLERALDVLESFALPPFNKSLGEISALTGINKSAVQRISRTLVNRGYLVQDDSGLRPGPSLLDRSFDYLRSNQMVERASQVLLDLRRESGERVDLILFDASHDLLTVVYALRLHSRRETFHAALPGRREPTAGSAGGRACLSRLPKALVEEILASSEVPRLTPRTITDIMAIRDKVDFGREHGYCLSTEETLPGEIVVAAAVVDGTGQPTGAIHVAGSLDNWTESAFCVRFAPLAMAAAQAISG